MGLTKIDVGKFHQNYDETITLWTNFVCSEFVFYT
jgi:hypothetical protein